METYNEPRVQETQQVNDHQSYISTFAAYLTIHVTARSTSTDMTTGFHARPYRRFIEIQSRVSPSGGEWKGNPPLPRKLTCRPTCPPLF